MGGIRREELARVRRRRSAVIGASAAVIFLAILVFVAVIFVQGHMANSQQVGRSTVSAQGKVTAPAAAGTLVTQVAPANAGSKDKSAKAGSAGTVGSSSATKQLKASQPPTPTVAKTQQKTSGATAATKVKASQPSTTKANTAKANSDKVGKQASVNPQPQAMPKKVQNPGSGTVPSDDLFPELRKR